MLNISFVATLAVGLFALVRWGVRTLPGERWQMLAAVPISKAPDGSWRGLNLTYYGFFSATGTTFGFVILLVLLGSVGIPIAVSVGLVLLVLAACVPASRLIASVVERKRNTFTVAGAAFVATLVLPWLVVLLQPVVSRLLHREIFVLPIFAATAIAYVLAEAVGRLACLSFGCCYGMPLRSANPAIARLFQKHNLVIHGSTRKAEYASGLGGEPLIPVQALTSGVFATAGLAGIWLFLAQQYRAAALVPVIASWAWRAGSEWLRADHRGTSKISAYQWMAIFSLLYLGAALSLMPVAATVAPELSAGLGQVFSASVVLTLQLFWTALFVYYGRSRVTASTVSFHVVTERV